MLLSRYRAQVHQKIIKKYLDIYKQALYNATEVQKVKGIEGNK